MANIITKDLPTDDWPMVPLPDVLSTIIDNRGKTVPVSTTGIPLIATDCIKEDALYPSRQNLRYVSQEVYETWFRGHPEPGDVILVNKGTPGRVCQVPDPIDFCIAQDMVALRAKPGVINPDYLLTALRSQDFKEQVESLHVGTMIPHLKKGDFPHLRIPLPPLNIQEKIGRLYCDISRKLEADRQMNRTLEETAGALYRSWFVDFDPVVAKAAGRAPAHLSPALAALFPAAFQDSDLGPIPKGWRTSTVDGVVSLIIDHRGKTPTKLGGDWVESGIQAVSAKNVKAGRLVNKSAMGHISEELYRKWMRDELEAGDILMTSEAPLGELLYLPEKVKWCQSQRLFGLRANPEVCLPSFLYGWLSTPECQAELDARSSGTTVMGIRQSELRTVPVMLPSKAIQEKYDEIVGPMLLQIWHNESESETLAALRDTLLPKLLSGEVRVKEAEQK